MNGYIISVKNNTLKVSLSGTEQVAEKVVESGLSSPEIFAEALGSLMLETFGPKANKLPLNFLVEPDDIYLNFLTVTKGNSDDEQLMDLAKSKLGAQGVALENLFFTYQKIAPFVYQLVGIKQETLEKYLKVSTELGFELASVVPWSLLLPKTTPKSGEPVIFVLNNGSAKYLVLSELGGIYHMGLLDNTKSSQEIEELIQKLSVYQRNTPITNVFTLNMPDLNLGDKYKISALDIKDLHAFVAENMTDPAVFNTQLNLLTLLPVPDVVKKPAPMVYVGGVLGALLLVGVFFGVKNLNNGIDDSQLAQNIEASPVVLSEVEESSESTEETTPVVEEETTEEGATELNKAYLRVRVENGTSIGGLAGRTQTSLAALGYDIVSIGDANESDRVATSVSFSSANTIYKDLLEEDLKTVFGSLEFSEDLDATLDYDVLIVAGSDDVSSE
ncbi:LytR C-terminal domain-containing protein [candidate division WWE3 bacterium]|jgi:hypothetical protein|nr:LytR C-terminal domain-containing protein [candidate division WWE3 bacterium]MBT7349408.1 LytR C-terminal domain-containing protein [candidate division WWE3 bacterium]